MKPVEHCDECFQLATDVENIIDRLMELTTAELDALQTGDHAAFRSLGADNQRLQKIKETAVSAQREHARKHAQQSLSKRNQGLAKTKKFGRHILDR